MGEFAKMVELLYGIAVPPFDTAGSMFADAMAYAVRWGHWRGPLRDWDEGALVKRYAGCEDAFRVALENGLWPSIYSDVFGLMTNAVLAAAPSHRAVWVELEAPHIVWYYAEEDGWIQLRGDESSGSRFLDRCQRSSLLLDLLPDASNAQDDAKVGRWSRAERAAQHVQFARWRVPYEPEPPTEDTLRDEWARADRTGCAEALISLWRAFFFDAPGLLIELLDATEEHPSTAVASARKLVHAAQWSRRSDDLFVRLRAHRAAFREPYTVGQGGDRKRRNRRNR